MQCYALGAWRPQVCPALPLSQLQNEILNVTHIILLKIWNMLLIYAKSMHWKLSNMVERNERRLKQMETHNLLMDQKMMLSLLPTLINRFCAILVKNLAVFLEWSSKVIVKFIWRFKEQSWLNCTACFKTKYKGRDTRARHPDAGV